MSTSTISFKLDGVELQAQAGETVLKAAQRHGVDIPHLCFSDGLRADGNCRACVVEVAGERTLAPSCCRTVTHGMEVKAKSERALKSQKLVLELLLADRPDAGHKWADENGDLPHGELSHWASQLGVTVRPELKALRAPAPAPDLSHPAMAVNLDACIQCTRCVRACRETQMNDVIGVAYRGGHAQIVFDLGDAMGESSCVACGECVQACPTGALMPRTLVGDQRVDKSVDSVCPYCGVGCLLTYKVRDNTIVAVEGRDGPANQGRLCVKGRFGFDYAHHAQRLTKPLIRKAGVPKDTNSTARPGDWRAVFREATWDEALEAAAGGLKHLRDTHGKKALAGFGSAKGSNEEAYLFQKLVRTGFGSNNVDHCTRLCHASSVAALLEGVGSGAVSNPVKDVEHAAFVLVIGSNPTSNHPVAATWMKNAAARGTQIVLADPRRTDLHRHAWRSLQFKADTDVALLNAMLHVVIAEGLTDADFIARRVDNFEALREQVQHATPEAMSPICGIAPETIREVARAYATSPASMILWGMGVSQHTHGTDNVRCLIALASITGQIGRPGTGLHPLRGQNNVQGASDAGLIPMMYPNYQRVDTPEVHDWFEAFWNTELDSKPGLTVVEILHKAQAPASDPQKIWGMYVMGENPAMSDPDLNHAREGLASLQHLVVQDLFMTETAWLADVVLPASAWPEKTGTVTNTDRMVQMGRRALDLPGGAKPDLWIIQQLAQRMGLAWNYEGEEAGVAAVFEEMRQAMHGVIAGVSWERLEREDSVTYPCLSAEDPGQPIVFTEHFATADGRVQLVPAGFKPAAEVPDADYPFVLITGRQLEHWHTGSMTRRSQVLDAVEPHPTVSLNGSELVRLGVPAGGVVTVRSRRGTVALHVRRDDGMPPGTVFIPFAYAEAAANLLTNPALDPFGKIPEFKYCAVAVSAGGDLHAGVGYGGGESAPALAA
ncbi:MAG TPA: formate dehydrogenase subunit alpha [Hydrogenophaga sp.]|uniref:formate dehydrogenase subunit alpha n=1 Tax=Hydrogenophaga sp. TaxID=1904254 RepID=UPI0008D1FB20|nr:formate dehydrogenase subunit alpha [Hydrogenophaga sp.]OGA77890.1 MAG: formate dehydrogenase subunit alpha [Burkholderiales bacterium GWE1_65_30]OGA94240.1 MAG: formate dehydrogenase subunit alpha [Burkholderiales bacterium GWF1_66_17]HAX22311.1 formate dehydrogenase subunit alpha [Hydrogenophaga sp.]HBU20318.1 formate dehydrogenase subunit alpha [Hydrogenophaga sp.]